MLIPPGLYGHMDLLTNISLQDNVDVATCVTDPDYKVQVKVLLVNCSQKQFNIAKGETQSLK